MDNILKLAISGVLALTISVGMIGCGSPSTPKYDTPEEKVFDQLNINKTSINNANEEIQIKAVKESCNVWLGGYDNVIRYIKNPSFKVKMAAVTSCPKSLKFLKHPNESLINTAIKNGYPISWIKNPSKKQLEIALANDPYSIMFIKNPSKSMQLAAVKQKPGVLSNIENQFEEVQLEAVKKDGRYIQFCINPSEKVQLVAMRNAPQYYSFIKNPSEKVQLVFVKARPDSISSIKSPSEVVQLAAVKQNGNSIQYIKNPSEAVQLAAVKQSSDAIRYIKYPIPLVKAIGNNQIKQMKIGYTLKDKNLKLKIISSNTITLTNNTNEFLKILNFSQYYGDNIYTLKNYSLPPLAVKTITLYNNSQTISSINDKITIGFAIEYQLSRSKKIGSLYNTKKYSVKNLFK